MRAKFACHGNPQPWGRWPPVVGRQTAQSLPSMAVLPICPRLQVIEPLKTTTSMLGASPAQGQLSDHQASVWDHLAVSATPGARIGQQCHSIGRQLPRGLPQNPKGKHSDQAATGPPLCPDTLCQTRTPRAASTRGKVSDAVDYPGHGALWRTKGLWGSPS